MTLVELFPVLVGDSVHWALAVPPKAQVTELPAHRRLSVEELELMTAWVDELRREHSGVFYVPKWWDEEEPI